MQFDFDLLPVGAIAVTQRGHRYVKDKGGWRPETSKRYVNRSRTPGMQHDPVAKIISKTNISEDIASRLECLNLTTAFYPRWNQEKQFVFLEGKGLATSVLVKQVPKGNKLMFRRGFLLTQHGLSTLADFNRAAQPADAEKTQ